MAISIEVKINDTEQEIEIEIDDIRTSLCSDDEELTKHFFDELTIDRKLSVLEYIKEDLCVNKEIDK